MKIDWFNSKTKRLFLENRSLKQIIFKNTIWLFFSEITTRVFTVILAIFIARKLGVENYGLLSFAISLTALFSVFYNFCNDSIIVRELTQNKKTKEELGAILGFRIFLGFITFFLIITATFFIENSAAVPLIIIFAGVILVDAVTSFLKNIFRAFQKIEYFAATEIGKAISLATGGFIVLFTCPNIIFIANIYLLASVFAVLIALFSVWRLSFLPPLRLDIKIAKKYFYLSWPLTLSAVFNLIYVQIDLIMMGSWGMVKEVGWYNAAYKVVNFIAITSLVRIIFFPVITQAYKKTKEYFQKIINNFLELILIFAFPIVAGGFLLSRDIILFIYHEEFIPSVLVFEILVFVSGLLLIIALLDAILVAAGRQRTIFYITGSIALLNIVLNFILIPRYSLYGAAVATLISYIFLFLLMFIAIRKIKISLNFKSVFLPFLATVSMLVFLNTVLVENLHIIVRVIFGGFVYFLIFGLIYFFSKKIINKSTILNC